MFPDCSKRFSSRLAEKLLTGVLITSLTLSPLWVSPLQAQPTGAPTLGPASAADLSPALERKLGEAIMEQGRRDPDYISDPDIDQYLNSMARKLAPYAPGGAPEIEAFSL